MINIGKAQGLLVAVAVLSALSTHAYSGEFDQAIATFGRSTTPGETLEQFLERRDTEYSRFDVDGDGAITKGDLEIQSQRAAAMARSMAMRDLIVCDFDGDGVITRSEIEANIAGVTPMLSLFGAQQTDATRKQIKAAVDQRMLADANGDGRIDGAEIHAFARQHARPNSFRGNPLLWGAMALDQNNDGRVTREEYLNAAKAAFQLVDSDGNGTLSNEELASFRKQHMPPPLSARGK